LNLFYLLTFFKTVTIKDVWNRNLSTCFIALAM